MKPNITQFIELRNFSEWDDIDYPDDFRFLFEAYERAAQLANQRAVALVDGTVTRSQALWAEAIARTLEVALAYYGNESERGFLWDFLKFPQELEE